MAFATLGDNPGDEALAEINMVPLIDVMLVLLVIFIVAAPLLTQSVAVDLPRAAALPRTVKPDTIELAIDAAGAVRWNGEALSREALSARLAGAAQRSPVPELHLSADRSTPYENVARVMAEAARAGVTRIGFVTDPRLAQ